MSEASTAPAAAPAAAPAEAQAAAPAPAAAPAASAATSLTDTGGAPPATGEGEAAPAAGQGADAGAGDKVAAPAAGEEPAAGEGGDAPGAPEQYATFTLPEGYALEGEMLESVTAFAKAHKMTQEQAQGLVDLGAQQGQAIMAGYAKAASESPVLLAQHWAETWSGQTRADKDLGGQNLEQTLGLSRRVFATFGSPELGEFLNTTGLAHHPELIRFMHKVGKAVSEDTLVVPNGGQQSQERPGQNTAKKLYPSMN